MKIRGIAHRGYPVKYPENTLSSFKAAIDLGFTHMELDVHLSKDRIPVVMHDSKIDRMTDGKGEIRDYTFAELQQFTVGLEERIPSLKEVLLLAKNRIIVSIELKNTKLYPDIEEKVYEVIRETEMVDEVYIISFNYKSLVKLRSISPSVELGLIVNRVKWSHFRLLSKINAKYFAVKCDALKERHIVKLINRGIQPVVWTVNSLEKMLYFKNRPSVLTTTDELEKYKSIYDNNLFVNLKQA